MYAQVGRPVERRRAPDRRADNVLEFRVRRDETLAAIAELRQVGEEVGPVAKALGPQAEALLARASRVVDRLERRWTPDDRRADSRARVQRAAADRMRERIVVQLEAAR